VLSTLAVVVSPQSAVGRVYEALIRLGAEPALATGATARGAPLVAVLKVILRAVAIVDTLVCLYALIQVCALTVTERRSTVAVLRACGAGPAAIVRLLLGAALAVVVPAAVLGVALERLVLGPALSRLAESYATLPLEAGPLEVGVVLVGLAVAMVVAVAWVARSSMRESVVSGLAA
jgi:ABC-type lipoprotein release transport system permease subunit